MDLKRQIETGIKLRGSDKVARIPIKILPTEELPTKPDWIRAKITDFEEIKHIKIYCANRSYTVFAKKQRVQIYRNVLVEVRQHL